MSICVSVAVPDGIALAADSQTTWSRTITQAKAKTGEMVELLEPIQLPIGWSRMARKLFKLQFADSTYAVCTAGVASVNQKTIFSVLKSAESTYSGDGRYEEVVNHVRNALWAELKEEFETDQLHRAPVKIVTLILAGFLGLDVSKPILETHSVFSGAATIDGKVDSSGYTRRWNNSDQGRFACCWIGRIKFVTHIVNHQSKQLPPIQGQYHMMTLEDAKDYARFLVEYTCDFQRFAIMVPDCGRPVVVASLTPDGYAENVV